MKNIPNTFILLPEDPQRSDKRFAFLSRILIREGKRVLIGEGADESIMGERISPEKLASLKDTPLVLIVSFFTPKEERLPYLIALGENSRVFSGKLTKEEETLLDNKGIMHTNILTDDAFCRANAVPTAEGALAIAIEKTDIALTGKSLLILGFGRVGRETARVMKGVGMEVFSAVRSPKRAEEVKDHGCTPLFIEGNGILLTEEGKAKELNAFPLIINTVPPPGIITERVASLLCMDTVFIDLAPSDCAERLGNMGIRAFNAPSLPGRYAPESAAEYIYDTVRSYYSMDQVR